MRANQRVSASRCLQGPASIALCLHRACFAVAQAAQRYDAGLETPGIWRMSANLCLGFVAAWLALLH